MKYLTAYLVGFALVFGFWLRQPKPGATPPFGQASLLVPL